VIETDASDYALAAILSQVESNGKIHPVTYLSWTFSDTKLNHDTHDKELMAIYEAFKAWRHYLEGTKVPIDVVTNHKNLKYFCTIVGTLLTHTHRWTVQSMGFQGLWVSGGWLKIAFKKSQKNQKKSEKNILLI
jgi:RNase H-like domain found in reverse transcriptase